MTRPPIRLLPRIARRRLREHLRPIVQTAVAAVLAWSIARLLRTEPQPVFASIAATICLGATLGERRQKALQLTAGVALGIVVADVLVRTLGTGLPQLGLLVLLAMSAAVVIGGGEMLIGEAAVSAMLIASLPPSAAGPRLAEVLIGAGVALVVNALVLPPNPLVSVTRAANAVFDEVGTALRNAGSALARGDSDLAELALQNARLAEGHLRDFERVLELGEETARFSPARRATRARLARFRPMVDHLDLVIGETRLLVRDVLRHVRSGRKPQPDLGEAVLDLGRAVWEVPTQLEEPWRGGDVPVLALGGATRATAATQDADDLLVREIGAHVRSVAIDIVRASEAVGGARMSLAEAPTDELLTEVAQSAGEASDSRQR